MATHLLNELSVFLPCYNEEANLQNTFNKIIPIIKDIATKWEIIIVDDGSKDKTGSIASALVKQYPQNVRLVSHHPNRGYGAAFKSGFYQAKYEWIVLIDGDGQFDFNEVSKLINAQKDSNSDLVIGYYLGRKVSFIRIWGTKIWQLAVYILFGLKVRDIDCGFKLVSKKVIESIPKLQAERGPFITSEFLIKAKRFGFKITEVGVHHYERQGGIATGAQLNVIFSGLMDLIRLWFKLNLSK